MSRLHAHRRGTVLLLAVTIISILVVLATVFLIRMMGHSTSSLGAKKELLSEAAADMALVHAMALLDHQALNPRSDGSGNRWSDRSSPALQGFLADGGSDDVLETQSLFFQLLMGVPYSISQEQAQTSSVIRNYSLMGKFGFDVDRINTRMGSTDSLSRWYGHRYFDLELDPVASAGDAFWELKYDVFVFDQNSLIRTTPDFESRSYSIPQSLRQQYTNIYGRSFQSMLAAKGGVAKYLNPRKDQFPGWMGTGWLPPPIGGVSGTNNSSHPYDENGQGLLAMFRGHGKRFQFVGSNDDRWGVAHAATGVAGPVLSPYQVHAYLASSHDKQQRENMHQWTIAAPGIVDPGMELDGVPWRYNVLTLAPDHIESVIFGLSNQAQFMNLNSRGAKTNLRSDCSGALELFADEEFNRVEAAAAGAADIRSAYQAAIATLAPEERNRWQYEKICSHRELHFSATGRFEPEGLLDAGANDAIANFNVYGAWTGKAVPYFPIDIRGYHIWDTGGTYAGGIAPDAISHSNSAAGAYAGDDNEYILTGSGSDNAATYYKYNTPDRQVLASTAFTGFRYPVFSPPWEAAHPLRDGLTNRPYWTGMEGRNCRLWPPKSFPESTKPHVALGIMNSQFDGTYYEGLYPYAGYRDNLIGDVMMAYIVAIAIAQNNAAATTTAGVPLAASDPDMFVTPVALDALVNRLLIAATDGTLDIDYKETGPGDDRFYGYRVTGGGTGSVLEMRSWLGSLRTDYINDPADPGDDRNDAPISTPAAEIVLNDFRMSLLGLAPEDFDGDGDTYGGAPPAASGTWKDRIQLDVSVPYGPFAGTNNDLTGHDLDQDGNYQPFSLTGRLAVFPSDTFRILVRGRLEPSSQAVAAGLYDPLRPTSSSLEPVEVFMDGIYRTSDVNGDGAIGDDEAHLMHLRRRVSSIHW